MFINHVDPTSGIDVHLLNTVLSKESSDVQWLIWVPVLWSRVAHRKFYVEVVLMVYLRAYMLALVDVA